MLLQEFDITKMIVVWYYGRSLTILAHSLEICEKWKIARNAHDVDERTKRPVFADKVSPGMFIVREPIRFPFFSYFFIDAMHTSVWTSYWEYRSASTLWNRNDVISLVCIGGCAGERNCRNSNNQKNSSIMQRLAIFDMKWNKHDRAAYHFFFDDPPATRDQTVEDRCEDRISRGLDWM